MTEITKIKKGEKVIPLEQPITVRCNYCPTLITKEQEAGGRLHYIDGRPACAKCRILRKSKVADTIKADKGNYEADLKKKEEIAQAQADAEIRGVAYDSQIATKTQLAKKK